MALIFEVWVNGERFAVAGDEALCVLSTMVTASGRLGTASAGTKGQVGDHSDVYLRVGGLTASQERRNDRHLNWGKRHALKAGDEVRVVVRNGDDFEPPSESTPATAYPNSESSTRMKFVRARGLYFRLRSKLGHREDKEDERRDRRYRRLVRW